MKKKVLLIISVLIIILSLGFAVGAEDDIERPIELIPLIEQRPYTESETIKIIDHVVYMLREDKNFEGKFYEVYDWFDTAEAAKTVTEINIVPEIDGIKVKAIKYSDGIAYIPGDQTKYCNEQNYSVKKVSIPDTVTYIGAGFFSILDGMEELEIPATVTDVYYDYDCSGSYAQAFHGMESLRKVTFSGDIEKVGGFTNCKKLEEVIFKGSVKEIMNRAFYNCKSLTTFTIPDTVEFIDGLAFGRTGLIKIRIPASVEKVGFNEDNGGAFEDCKKLTKVVFEDGKREFLNVSDFAFSGCTALRKIYLPKSVKEIGIGLFAFRNCRKLERIYNTKNVKYIASVAFVGCKSLKSLTLGNKVEFIGEYAFKNCKSLKKITFTGGKKTLPDIRENAFAKTKNFKFIVKNKKTGEVLKTKLTQSGLKTDNFKIRVKAK